MKKHMLILLGIMTILLSCTEKKYIWRNNLLCCTRTFDTKAKADTLKFHSLSTDSFYIYKVKNPVFAKIENKGNSLIITNISDARNLEKITAFCIPPLTMVSGDANNVMVKTLKECKFFFPSDSLKNKKKNFTFIDGRPVLQGLVIPIKIRPKLFNQAHPDSFPCQTETSFNPAIAFGWKFSQNCFHVKKDIFGSNLRQYSISPGVFLGTGAASLSKTTTRDPMVLIDRKAPLLSFGGFVMLGYGSINIGYSFGFDFSMGPGHSNWVYQGKIWHGITIGLDIIK